MATLGQDKANRNLLRGISSFWLRFFQDKEILAHLYSATDQLMGQLYLELLEALLANSITTVPVFAKEFWKLVTFNSSEVEISGTEYKFLLPDKIKGLNFLYNKIFEPSTILESEQDYRIEGDYIYFSKNIFDDFEYPGLAKRREGTSTIVSFWAPQAEVDKEYIYEHFGRMLDIYEPSSESYKSFIQGIWFYYMNGPTINRITSAMNIIGGYPVASEDGEIVLSIKLINNIYYIKTTANVYQIPDKVDLAVSVGDVLSAFQFLTTAYTVTDYIDDPNWFDNIIVPFQVIPSLSVIERTTNVNDPNPIFIGYPTVIGYPGWKIGLGGLPNFMWLFFNGVLKYNIFLVTYDALASQFLRTPADLTDIVLSGKPAFDLAMVVPFIKIQDTVNLPEEKVLEMDMTMDLSEDYDLSGLGDELYAEIEAVLPFDSYGKVNVAFGTTPTIIGSGVIGDATARLTSGVPERIGTNTVGLTESGLYTEFPLEIFIM